MVEKISKLSELFSKYKINGYLVPSSDEFFNEYVPTHLRRLEYLTGFSGSNGIALITQYGSALFTDGRYLLQASLEIPSDITVYDQTLKQLQQFKESIEQPLIIGFDPRLFNKSSLKMFSDQFQCLPITPNLIDEIWLDKPSPPSLKIISLSEHISGMSTADKLQKIAKQIPHNADYLLINALDSICWLLNIRGDDIPFTPLLLAHALLDKEGNCKLFLRDNIKVPNTEVILIDKFFSYISNKRIALSETETSLAILEAIPPLYRINSTCPIQLIKACKNPVELQGMQDCHLQDGIALCKFMYWLDQHPNLSNLNECDLADKLLELRTLRENFISPSFATISAFAENGAIIHYNPTPKTAKYLNKEGLYLLDSGGQYLNGTTDVTRVMLIGTATEQQKFHYTLVLKGHIALANLQFPITTTGHQIDAIARQYLWQHGLNYQHGTGHGVGHFLAVHEGPQRVSPLANKVALQPGMVISNEPGIYLAGHYGIRLENLVYVHHSTTPDFLQFSNLTLAPFDIRLIDFTMLTPTEKKWIEDYHRSTYNSISPFLTSEERDWLIRYTGLAIDFNQFNTFCAPK